MQISWRTHNSQGGTGRSGGGGDALKGVAHLTALMKAKAMAMATVAATAQLSQSLSAKKPPTQSRKQISKQANS